MDNNQLSLPQFTLDQLSERVCKKLPVFTKIPTDKMWEGILDLCAEIEKEPRVVFSVIPKVKEQYKYSISEGSTTVQTYRTVFTRIYIILYYRHADKAGSEYDEVFSQLAQRMGIYAGDTLKNIIRPGIESALKFDKQVEQALKEKKKEVKPVFAYVDHSRPEMDRLFDEYSDESLFCSMSGIINELSERYGTHLDEANVWYNAKQVVRALGQLKRPDLFIDRAATSLVMGQMYKGYEGSQIILLCVYAMVRSAKDNVHFAKFIKAMEEYANEETFKHVVFKKHIGQIKKWIDEDQPFDGYDYIGGTLMAGETFTRADVERITSTFQAKAAEAEKSLQDERKKKDNALALLNQRENEIKELRQKISAGQSVTAVDGLTTVEDMTIELLSHLFKENGVETARAFYNEVVGKEEPVIADVVKSYEEKFIKNVKNVHIWRFLHAARIYQRESGNFDAALRQRKFREVKPLKLQ